jgi:hypothetical protein
VALEEVVARSWAMQKLTALLYMVLAYPRDFGRKLDFFFNSHA